MTSAVFDCMVFLQAATSDRGPAFACLALAESNEVTLYVSPAILTEVRDVLTRPEIQCSVPAFDAGSRDSLLAQDRECRGRGGRRS